MTIKENKILVWLPSRALGHLRPSLSSGKIHDLGPPKAIGSPPIPPPQALKAQNSSFLNTQAGLGQTRAEHLASCPGPQSNSCSLRRRTIPGAPTWPPSHCQRTRLPKDTLLPLLTTMLTWKPACPSLDSCPRSTQNPELYQRQVRVCGL